MSKLKKSRSDKKRERLKAQKGIIGNKKTSQKGVIGNSEPIYQEVILSKQLNEKEIVLCQLGKLKNITFHNSHSEAFINRNPSNNGFSVEVVTKKGKTMEGLTLITKRGHIRSFKTIDSAYKVVLGLGIKTAVICG